MNGVEILNQTNIYYEDGNMWVFWILLGLGFIVGLIVTFIILSDEGFCLDCLIFIFGGMAIDIILGFLGYVWTLSPTDELSHVEYKVIVSDEVSFTDFMEKYEIIDQEGQIYTVKERGQNK